MGLYAAIYAMIGATALQMLITRFQTGKFEKHTPNHFWIVSRIWWYYSGD